MKVPSILLACCVLLSAPAGAQSFKQAVQDHRAGRWSAAYGQFAHLASRGDADAARIALFMHRQGPLLYGTHWDASSDDTEAWAQLAETGAARAEPPFQPLRNYASSTSDARRPPPRLKSVALQRRAAP
jgi:hypothetical protein